MIVAGLQWDLAWEDPAANARRARELGEEAREGGAELLVLPEMFNTGFTMQAAAAARHAGRAREFLVDLARDLGCAVLGGFVEEGVSRPRNVCALYDAEGHQVLHYHKVHPFTLAGEAQHYEAGERLETASLGGLRITPVICYDLRFPELFRVASEHTDLYLVVANWPSRRGEAWRTLLRARAIENQAYVLGVNRVGEGGGLDHEGATALVDPFGATLAELRGQEGVVQGEVTAQAVADVRRKLPFLGDRRDPVYRQLRDQRELRDLRGAGEQPIP